MLHHLRPLLASAAIAISGPAMAIHIGTFNGFAPGDLQGWYSGAAHPKPVEAIAGGGPGGAADAFIEAYSVGGAPNKPGNRFAVFAGGDWLGDYVHAGVVRIEMDVRNFGSTDLYLRLAFNGNGTVSLDPVFVPAGSGWRHVSFATVAPALTDGAALLDVTELRLVHSEFSASPRGESIVAALGIDNVRAVPEPESAALLLSGILAVARLRRR